MQLLLSDEGGILSTLLGLQTGSAPRVYRQGHGMEKTSHPPPFYHPHSTAKHNDFKRMGETVTLMTPLLGFTGPNTSGCSSERCFHSNLEIKYMASWEGWKLQRSTMQIPMSLNNKIKPEKRQLPSSRLTTPPRKEYRDGRTHTQTPQKIIHPREGGNTTNPSTGSIRSLT